jgi:hypothetical protein
VNFDWRMENLLARMTILTESSAFGPSPFREAYAGVQYVDGVRKHHVAQQEVTA